MKRLTTVKLTKVQIPKVRIRLSRLILIWLDKNNQGTVTHCKVIQGKSAQSIITQGNYKVNQGNLCGIFMYGNNTHYVTKDII